MIKDLEPSERMNNLIKQHKEIIREGYDGHNRKPVTVSIHVLSRRRTRREFKRILREWEK